MTKFRTTRSIEWSNITDLLALGTCTPLSSLPTPATHTSKPGVLLSAFLLLAFPAFFVFDMPPLSFNKVGKQFKAR